jgi:hypothetical protein
MNSERRTVALALVQQAVIEKNQHTIAELHECTVLADIKEIEDDQLCIRIYNHEKSDSIIIARDNINMKVSSDHEASFSYLKSTVALFGVHAQGEYLKIWDESDWSRFDIVIVEDDDYSLYSRIACYDINNMHISVMDKICKAIYAFMNRLPIN